MRAGASQQTHTAVLLGVLLCAAVALRGHPNHLGYFNELAGDQESDIPLLLDSNLDWGQGLLRLSQELTARGETLDGLAYFGSFPPAALDFTGKAPPSYGPQPGRYAVSLNFVHGRPHVLRDEAGQWRIVNLDEFGYLRFFEPRHPTCYGIAIFDLSEQDVARFHRALQQIPGANPSPR